MASAEVIFKFARQGSAPFWGETPETQANYQEFMGLHTEYWGDRISFLTINENERQTRFTVFDDNPDETHLWATSEQSERFNELTLEFLNYCQTNGILITWNYYPWDGTKLFNGVTDFHDFL